MRFKTSTAWKGQKAWLKFNKTDLKDINVKEL